MMEFNNPCNVKSSQRPAGTTNISSILPAKWDYKTSPAIRG